ncbi:hypothetical protein THAR02_08277 [Trichoderma harzianum]|uniref:AB hydrolase-1 domain-containing protein n=1 Tax=Trichoderma harzianum TaxID=5544 RepID=A0A0F9X347_TRIHA|nr:hypothetical protein THAR02_08277 [Trichoderma harzianum]
MFTKEEFENIGSLDSKPMLVVLHGMNGGSGEAYLRRSLMPFINGGEEWEACVVNSRGCAGSQLGNGILYNARSTWDLRQIVEWLQQKFPNRPLFALGFSMGANMLVHYLAEEGQKCPIRAAAICSNPWNLELSPQMGLPIEEAKANPYVVLVVTSFGGHLGWFQQDGSRWFIQAIYNTLQQFWEKVESVLL